MKKLLFIDLDGTIIETVSGEVFPEFVGDMKFKNGILFAIAIFVRQNDAKDIVIVTNQAGVAHGHLTQNNVTIKCDFICYAIRDFLKASVGLDVNVQWYACTSDNPDHPDRKPNTGMLSTWLATNSAFGFTKDAMLMVGDASGLEGQFSDSDKKTAENFDIDYLDVSEFINKYNN
jgi:DNA 3'-phosphatase